MKGKGFSELLSILGIMVHKNMYDYIIDIDGRDPAPVDMVNIPLSAGVLSILGYS